MAVVFPFYNICTIISILLVRRPTTGVECRFEAMLPRQIHISAVSLVFAKMLVSDTLYGKLHVLKSHPESLNQATPSEFNMENVDQD